MACGAGLYLSATLAAATVLIVLEGVGVIEKRFNLKLYLRIYEVRGTDANEIEKRILQAMDSEGRHLGELERSTIGGVQRQHLPPRPRPKDTRSLRRF